MFVANEAKKLNPDFFQAFTTRYEVLELLFNAESGIFPRWMVLCME